MSEGGPSSRKINVRRKTQIQITVSKKGAGRTGSVGSDLGGGEGVGGSAVREGCDKTLDGARKLHFGSVQDHLLQRGSERCVRSDCDDARDMQT